MHPGVSSDFAFVFRSQPLGRPLALHMDSKETCVEESPFAGPPSFVCSCMVLFSGEKWGWVKIKPPGIGLQVLVLVSIYQGNPIWGYPMFDPQPDARTRVAKLRWGGMYLTGAQGGCATRL